MVPQMTPSARRLLVCVVAAVAAAVAPAPLAGAQSVATRADDRIELLAILFRLAGNPEYNQCRVPRYNAAIDAWFAPFKAHRAVTLAARLRAEQSVGFDGVMSMAIHITDASTLRPRRPLESPGVSLDRRWKASETGAFLDAAREFVRDAKFADFLTAQRPLLDSGAARLEALAKTRADLAWFERFFGPRPGARLVLVPGMCNGGGNYGPRYVDADGGEELYAIVGAAQVDSAGWPVFGDGALGLVVHEFNHSFVNPAIDARARLFERSGPPIFGAAEQTMRQQAYGSWPIVINESVVRAAAARYALATRGADAARRAVLDEQARGFLWTDELFDLLGHYERERATYPAFAAFVPEIAAFFDGLAPRVGEVGRAWDARRPKLISTSPASGESVSPALGQIVLRFDRPMSGGYSINMGPRGKEAYPEVTRVAFDSTKTVFTLEVKLVPDREYELIVSGNSFRSVEGVPLASAPLRFRTRGS